MLQGGAVTAAVSVVDKQMKQSPLLDLSQSTLEVEAALQQCQAQGRQMGSAAGVTAPGRPF